MRQWLFLILSFAFFTTGNAFCLRDRVQSAKPGDYIVTEANKMITVLCIRELNDQTVLLEEISAPVQNLKKRPTSWIQWIRDKAPGHTSWSMIEIDLARSELLECYSFTKSVWIHLSQKESLFATLLLSLIHISEPTRPY